MTSSSPGKAVAVVILRSDPDGLRTLMVKRAAHIRAAGYWTPVTGKLEAGEDHITGGLREVHEEVGIDVRMGEPCFSCPTHDGRYQLQWWTAYLEAPEQMLRLQPEEVAEARWLTLDQALTLDPMFVDTAEGLHAAFRHAVQRLTEPV
ncbi:MAG: 8-oxo-dGTP diphosphatase [Myxococcota bacterium]|jgi:8-oxo-dGTP diphosphatase